VGKFVNSRLPSPLNGGSDGGVTVVIAHNVKHSRHWEICPIDIEAAGFTMGNIHNLINEYFFNSNFC
jgi:hypothetical protein